MTTRRSRHTARPTDMMDGRRATATEDSNGLTHFSTASTGVGEVISLPGRTGRVGGSARPPRNGLTGNGEVVSELDRAESPAGHRLALRMADLTRSVTLQSVEDVLVDVTAAAMDLIPGVDVAGVLLIGDHDTYETMAPSSALMHKLDQLQIRCGEGPCLEAAMQESMVRTDDFRNEARFPTYASEVLTLGVRSALSFKLYTADRTAGALNLFGFKSMAWDDAAETTGAVLAAHAAVAIQASSRNAQLRSELLTRDRLGQAKGILMERFKMDGDQADALLRQWSSEIDIAPAETAQRIIESRWEPERNEPAGRVAQKRSVALPRTLPGTLSPIHGEPDRDQGPREELVT